MKKPPPLITPLKGPELSDFMKKLEGAVSWLCCSFRGEQAADALLPLPSLATGPGASLWCGWAGTFWQGLRWTMVVTG